MQGISSLKYQDWVNDLISERQELLRFDVPSDGVVHSETLLIKKDSQKWQIASPLIDSGQYEAARFAYSHYLGDLGIWNFGLENEDVQPVREENLPPKRENY